MPEQSESSEPSGSAELFDAVDALIASASPLPPPAERRRLRDAHGLSQGQVAGALHVRRATVSGWEAGRTEPRQPEREAYARLLRKLAELYPAGATAVAARVAGETGLPATGPAPGATDRAPSESTADTADERPAAAESAVTTPRALPAPAPCAPEKGARASRIAGPHEFGRMFTTFEHSAWRLEGRRRYARHERLPEYTAFTTGEHVHWDLQDPWCRNRREQTALGKRFQRVRVIDEPYTEGQLFLLLQNTPRNAASGEDIRFLTRGKADELDLPREDFWIFDTHTVALLHFDDEDERGDIELITAPADVLHYAQVREAAWHYAVPQERMADALGV
jgi:DNA-binding transcriptional regulator YiaG